MTDCGNGRLNMRMGRAEIAAGLEQMFAGPMKGTQIVLTPTKIRAITTEVAVVEATFEMTGILFQKLGGP